MNWPGHVSRSLAGAWQLARLDADGYDLFDLSERGFWWSFSAIVIIAPLYLYGSSIDQEVAAATGGLQDQTVAMTPVRKLLGLVLQWGLWPLIMVYVARAIDASKGYVRYIVSYNWSSVLIAMIQMPPVLLHDAGIISFESTMALIFTVLMIALFYRWFVARTALEISGPIAGALVFADLAISIAVSQVVS